MTRASDFLSNLGQNKTQSEMLTNCKLCRHGIFRSQKKVWLPDPMGLSHEDCAKRAVS